MSNQQYYQELLQCMERWGAGIKSESHLPKGTEYERVPFSPEALVGLAVHSLLSGRPRPNFFTDGKNIYYPHEVPAAEPDYAGWQDILRETELAKLLHYDFDQMGALQDIIAKFSEYDGHLRLCRFEDSFRGPQNGLDLNLTSLYDRFLSGGTISIIKQEEQRRLRQRVCKYWDELQELLTSMSDDPAPLPTYARMLEKSLRQYSPEIARRAPEVPEVS